MRCLFVVWIPLYIIYDSRVMLWNLGRSELSLLEGLILYPKILLVFQCRGIQCCIWRLSGDPLLRA